MDSSTSSRATSARATVPSSEEILEYERLKALAAKMFNEKQYENAIKHYDVACAFIYSEGDTNLTRLSSYLTCKNNAAQCCINLGDYKGAIKFTIQVLLKDPKNVKALYRRGISFMNLNYPEKALDDLYAAFTIDPNNKETQRELKKAATISICLSMESKLLNKDNIVRLLKMGADTNQINSEGNSLLIIASMNGSNDMVELLLQNGASIDYRSTNFGMSALYIASQQNHISVVTLLLDHKADINAPSKGGFNSLYIASQHGHHHIVNLLLERNADINTQSDNGSTPLIIASQKGHYKIVDLLLSKGSSVNHKDTHGSTALHIAIQQGHLKIVELLLSRGADIKHRDILGTNAIIMASMYNRLDILKLLLAKGAYAHHKDNQGKSCLQHTECNEIKRILKNWYVTMSLVVLEDLRVLSGIDPRLFILLRKYMG
jgi:ankyrin repeat protein